MFRPHHLCLIGRLSKKSGTLSDFPRCTRTTGEAAPIVKTGLVFPRRLHANMWRVNMTGFLKTSFALGFAALLMLVTAAPGEARL